MRLDRSRARPRRKHGLGLAALGAAVAVTAAVGVVLPSTAGAASPVRVVGAGSGRCVDVPAFRTTNGTQLQLWDCNGGTNQQVTLSSSRQLTVMGKCLDDAGWGRANATEVVVWDCTGAANQQWALGADGSVRSVNAGLCLDADRAATGDGTLLQLWPCTGASNQRWSGLSGAAPAPTPAPTPAPVPGPSSTTCQVAPVDPQATTQARKLLCYLYSQYGNHILSGQQESTWLSGGADREMNYLQQNTGKLPAIRGMDVGDGTDVAATAVTWWNAGGLIELGYHMGAPNQVDDGYTSAQQQGNIDAALTSGTVDNGRLLGRLDKAAGQLLRIQQAGGAVIWRPYHEAGGTWFWWSKEGGAQYQRLWKYTFDYLTRTKGLHNLVWLLPYDGSPQASFYPGKAYVDVAGADDYASDHGPLNGLYTATRNIVGSSIPIALHENGPIPDPDQLQASGTRWVLFNTWDADYLTDPTYNPVASLKKFYNSSYVVTRDEVPNLR